MSLYCDMSSILGALPFDLAYALDYGRIDEHAMKQILVALEKHANGGDDECQNVND